MKIEYTYKLIKTKNNVIYQANIYSAARFLQVDHRSIRKIENTSKRINGYRIEKLEETMTFETPELGTKLVIEGVKCTVVATEGYTNTFIVEVKQGDRRQVSYEDLTFTKFADRDLRTNGIYKRKQAMNRIQKVRGA